MKNFKITHSPDQALRCALVVIILSGILPANADRGELIYRLGDTQTGKAFLGEDRLEAPSTLFPCLNCHGEQGAGSKEAGLTAPNVTWQQLLLPFRKDLNGGVPRTPYNASSFGSALNLGVNSEGVQFGNMMPRYSLNNEEIQALVDYLTRIESQSYRGIGDKQIHFLLRLPDSHSVAQAMRETVALFTDATNERGGVYRRELILHEADNTDSVPDIFCVLDLRLLNSPNDEPDILSLSVFSKRSDREKDYYLYDHPGDFHKLKSMLAKSHGFTPVQLGDGNLDAIIGKLEHFDAAQIGVTALMIEPQSDVLEELLTKLMHAKIAPVIVSESNLLSPQARHIAEQYPAPIFMVSPPGPQSVSVRGQHAIAELSPHFTESGKYLDARLWSLALMKLLVTTLEQSGRELSEHIFVNTLQSHVELETEFGPALSYSASRRVGNIGAQFMRLN